MVEPTMPAWQLILGLSELFFISVVAWEILKYAIKSALKKHKGKELPVQKPRQEFTPDERMALDYFMQDLESEEFKHKTEAEKRTKTIGLLKRALEVTSS